jgi:HAD superfamily hydrolase (TIGR01509 family)
MSQHPFHAVIFDMDGVLIDTVLLHWRAYNEILVEKYGVSMPTEELHTIIGMSLAEQVPILNERFSITIDADAFIQEANLRKETAMTNLVPKEGVVQLLDQLKTTGILLGVGTSTSEPIAKARLEKVGIRDYFDVIVGEESVIRHKPNPEVYLRVADALHVAPEACIVFEDAPSGIRAAKEAGMHAVAVQTAYVPVTMLQNADRVIQGLDKVSIEDLASIFKKGGV